MKTKSNRCQLIALVLLSIGFHGCNTKTPKSAGIPGGPGARPPVPVTVTPAKVMDVPITVGSLGKCISQESINITAQVPGEIKEVHVAQGSYVEINEMLYTIDPRKYEATLAKLEAELAKAEAQLQLDEAKLTRSKSLLPDNYISQQEFETCESKVLQDRASIKQIEAQIVQAKVDLEHCHITSPINGLMGKYQVDCGNVVSQATVLANIQNVWQLYVDFSIAETYFPDLNRYLSEKDSLDVEVSSISDPSITATGTLDFVNNSIDPSSGTIHLRASLENEDTSFWPGQSVTVRLKMTTLNNAITLPTEAIKIHGNNRYYVLVAKPDNTAELRQISVGETYNNRTVIKEGLAADETVILKGNIMLGNGSQIIVMQQDE